MINLVQLSKSANRISISCVGVIGIMISIASLLFAIKIHCIIISLDFEAPHVPKNHSSSFNLELFDGSNSSTSGNNNSKYHMCRPIRIR
eukprot:scaffold7161_cov103-Skeletonema_dohrnii-CCMP3373.AAC.2